jgi:hypothetical protein
MSTRITEDNITSGSITANSFAEGISLGGTDESVTIDQIIVADSNFANTEETQIPTTGGFLKLYGNNYTTNSNVYFSNTFALTSQATANVVSNNEIQVTIGVTSVDTYNLFVFNEVGSFAFKESAITSFLLQATAGWFGGGSAPGVGVFSRVDRIIFATDTETASVRGPLSTARGFLASTGNDNYGWFGGGEPFTSLVDRITFSADTGTASVRGPLSLVRLGIAATGNDNYGWFGGGSPPITSTVSRIDFADDTGIASVRGPLSSARYNAAATGNDNYGWFGGGKLPSTTALVNRIDFADDTNTASVRGSLSSSRYQLAATSSQDFGWFGGGGLSPGGILLSRVDRITFANDTATATARGPLSLAKRNLSATGNNDYGWFAGGFPGPGAISTIDRIDFADDTGTASVRGLLSLARREFDAVEGIA